MRQEKNRRSAVLRAAARPVSEVLESRRLLAGGALDPSFGGGDGAVLASFPGAGFVQDSGQAMVVRPDGKIWLAGTSGDGSAVGDQVGVARFNANGTPDTTFDTDGMITHALGAGAGAYVADAAVQTDGKLVVVGSVTASGATTSDWFVLRLNEDGSIDSSFGGGDGIFTRDFGFNRADDAYGVAIQGDGKIVVTGVGFQDTSNMATMRLTAEGAPDASFGGGDGEDVVDFFGGGDLASDVIVDPDGKIVVAGGSQASGGYRQFVLLRYDSGGVLDNTFSGDGKASTDFGFMAYGRQLLRQADGKYVVGGTAGTGTTVNPYAVARYNADGTPDGSFGTNVSLPGTVAFPGIRGHAFTGYGIAQQADGKLLFGGYAQTAGSETYFGAVRLTTAGAPDATFGTNGVQTHNVPGTVAGFGSGADLELSADGRILIGGEAYVTNASNQTQYDFAVLQLTADGPAPVTVAGGVLTVTGTDQVDTLTLSADATTFTAVLNGTTYTFAAADVTSINVDLKAGNDTQSHEGNVPGGTVLLGTGNDTLTVGTGNKISPELVVTGGDGNDTVTLGVAFFTPTTFLGGAGTDTLNYNGSQGNDDLLLATVNTTRSRITNGGFDPATYETVEAVNVLGNFGFDTIRLQSSNANINYRLDGGEGDDVLRLGNADFIGSPATLAGGGGADEIVFDDSTNTFGDDYTLTPTTFARTFAPTFTYESTETLRVNSGNGSNDFFVTPSANTAMYISAGNPITNPGDSLTLTLTGVTGTTQTTLGTGSARYTFTNRQPVEFTGVERDLTVVPQEPPAVTSAAFEYQTRHSITFTFSKDVSSSVSLNDLVLKNLTTGQTIDPSTMALTVSSPGSPTTARWDYNGVLPDGNYTATLPRVSISDGSGNQMAADYTLSFYALGGDFDRNRVVNFDDLLILASNFNQSPRNFSTGDADFNGIVNFDDLLRLASNFNKTLTAPPAPASATPLLAAATSTKRQDVPVFSTQRVEKPAAAKPKAAAKPAKR